MHVNPVFGYKKKRVMFVTNAPGTSLAAWHKHTVKMFLVRVSPEASIYIS